MIVVASGLGVRMYDHKPTNKCQLAKQYIKLDNGLSVLDTTLKTLLALPMIDGCIVVLNQKDKHFSRSQYVGHPKILSTVIGGKERYISVYNGLKTLALWADNQDWVLIHDGVRCCVLATDVQNLMTSLANDAIGGLLASPVVDTLKQTNGNNVVEKTINRQLLWQAHTPQMFRFGLLQAALNQIIKNKQNITDDAQAMEYLGHTIKVIAGDKNNIKITYIDDINRANLILAQQKTQ